MSLSLRQKSDFYRELGQLLRSGKPFPASVQMLYGDTRGAVKKLLGQLRAAVDGGATVGDAFAAQYPSVSHLEASIIGACARTGRIDQGCNYLSEYYGALESARRTVIRKLLYPVFVLHFAVLVSGLPALVVGGGVLGYLKSTFGFLILLYLIAFGCWLLASLLQFEGARRTAVDKALRMIPVFGKIRRSFSLARFCATYEMQLQSGVNVIDSLVSANKASQSALIGEVVGRAIPLVRSGAQVGPLLSGTGAFPQDMVRAFKIGEETGELDAELKRMAHYYQGEGVAGVEFLSSAIPKALYLLVLLYGAWVVVKMAMGYYSSIQAAFPD